MTRRAKILIIIPASLLVLLGGLYLALFHLGLIEYLANRELGSRIGSSMPLQVHIGDINGDYFTGLILEDVTVVYNDNIESYTMAQIPQLAIEYSLKKLWQGKLEFEKISIDSADITLRKSRDRQWLIPKASGGAKRGEIILNFQVPDLQLNNLRLNLQTDGDTLTFSDIGLRAHIEGRENTYSAIIEKFKFRSSDSRFNLASAAGKITLTGNNVMFQDVVVVTDSSEAKINGMIVIDSKLQTSLEVNARTLSLVELSSFINARLTGRISAIGKLDYEAGKITGDMTVSGHFEERRFDSLHANFSFIENKLTLDTLNGLILGGCQINGKGDIDFSVKPEEYHLTGTLGHLNLNNLIFNTYRSDLSGRINMSGKGFNGHDLVLEVMANLDESWFDQYHAHKALGYMTITTDSLLFNDEFTIMYYSNTFTATGKLEYRGSVELVGKAYFDDLSAFNHQIFLDSMGGRGEVDFYAGGELNNPDLSGTFSSDSLWIYGIYSSRANAKYDIKHFLYDRKGTVDVRLLNGNGYTIPFDTAFLKMRIDSQFVMIDSSFIYNKYCTINSSGNLDYLSFPQHLALDYFKADVLDLRLENEGRILVDIDSSGYDFINCKLVRDHGYIECAGRVNYNETMDFRIGSEGIDITPWIRLYSDEYDIGGMISGEAQITGNFLLPMINYEGKIDSLRYRELTLGNLSIDCSYVNRQILIDSIILRSKYGLYKGEGEFPADLSFTTVAQRFPDEKQDIRITAYDTEFDLVSLLLYEVEDLTGEFRSDFQLTGTPHKPNLDGQATIRNGRLKLYDLVLPLENLFMDLRMVNRTVFIDSAMAICKGGENKTGIVAGKGEIVINSIEQFDYNINVAVKEFPVIYELGDLSALVDANMSVRGLTPPTVYGNVYLTSALYRENFAAEDEGWVILSSLQSENSWDLNLNVEAKSNLWIKNDDIDAELAGNLNFIREKGRYRYIGSMEILRGKGFWADRTFRIDPGGMINYQDIEYPNPTLDIYASTRIRGSSPNQVGGTERTNVDLRVHVTGTLNEPIISTGEGSQFSTEEILPLILLDYSQSDTTKTGTGTLVSDRLTAGLSSFVSSQVGKIGSRTLGVETFEIDPVYEDKFDPLGTRLTLGLYTHPNLYIYGRSSISGESGQELGFEYRLRRFLLMEGRADEGNLYRLFLNFYWDY